MTVPAHGPFDLADESCYRRWREAKLADYPARLADLVVAVADPAAPTAGERDALLQRCAKANMAIFAGPAGALADKERLRGFCARFGLLRLDANQLADDDGITPLAVAPEGTRTRYIPYTNRGISWHTDGYYNTADRQVSGLVLYCVNDAAEGGENDLLDHEIAYILLRDRSPALVAALSRPDAMTIPGNSDDGFQRPDHSGPVFSVRGGRLHMRYTARARNVVWKDDPEVAAAVRALEEILTGGSPYHFRGRLAPGQGLLSNNVLHTRTPFRDDPAHGPRLLFRARFYDRVAEG